MKRKLIEYLKIFFYKLGFYVEVIPNEKMFFEKCKVLDEDELWYELKRFSKVYSLTENIDLYDTVLKILIPNLEQQTFIEKSSFFGTGKGTNTLNAYRKVHSSGQIFFEKIYRTKSSDLNIMMWFYDKIRPQLNQNIIQMPPIKRIVKSKVITAVYFDFINLNTLSKPSMLLQAFSVSKHLMSISTSGPKRIALVSITKEDDNSVLNFENIYIKTARTYVEREFGDTSIFEQVLTNIFSYDFFLGHGDLNSKNIFGENYIIDWDSCGLYPIGFDVGKAINWLFLDNTTTVERIIAKIENNFKAELNSEIYERFLLGVLFFCFLFRASEITYGKEDVSSLTLNPLHDALELQLKTVNNL